MGKFLINYGSFGKAYVPRHIVVTIGGCTITQFYYFTRCTITEDDSAPISLGGEPI